MRPFHFAVLFWGEEYRQRYFLQYFLPSLLAPDNLPLLKALDGHKLVIATTREDWKALVHEPIMHAVYRHVYPQWIEIDAPIEHDDNMRSVAIRHQHRWFAKLLRTTHDRRAYGSVNSPDTIVANGLVRSMLRWVKEGHDCVIMPVLRQAEEPLLAELGSIRSIEPRQATELCIRHLHREIHPFIEPIHKRITHAPFRLWQMPDGMLLHAFFGLPVLMDYSVVSADYREGNIDTCLRTGNFSACKSIKIVDDSDEASIISLTPKDFKNYIEFPPRRLTMHDTLTNIRIAWQFFATDKARAQMFKTPVRWHTRAISPEWEAREKKIERMIRFATGNGIAPRLALDAPYFVKRVINTPKLRKLLGYDRLVQPSQACS